MHRSSRRSFIMTAGAGVALVGAPAARQEKAMNETHGKADRAEAIAAQMRRRADAFLKQDYLVVDYYRIRRKLAYPLPVTSLSIPEVVVPTIGNYPWGTWMLWTLEERVFTLASAFEWFGDEQAREAVMRDLDALGRWPGYSQYTYPDLTAGHSGRLLWSALARWKWLDEKTRENVKPGAVRLIEATIPLADKQFAEFESKDAILEREDVHRLVHNIRVIGTMGAAMCANVLGHKAGGRLNAYVQMLMGATLDMRERGFSEGVAYDGYVLDFAMDWLGSLPAGERGGILEHPRLRDYLDESYLLSAPGDAMQAAELSDVEPKEMPFHVSAQAKLQRFKPDAVRGWHLERCRLDWIRSDGLRALHGLKESPSNAPAAGAANAHYAVALRNGWDSEDLAVAMACSNSPMSHIQQDNGTITIGTQGAWFITDPGYQQYMKDAEREFTLGPTAHNTPVINGLAQTAKAPRLVSLGMEPDDTWKAAIELTGCYANKSSVSYAARTVWLWQKAVVVVADEVRLPSPGTLRYHWHGHGDAAWWIEDGWARLVLQNKVLWFRASVPCVSPEGLVRLPGSRGPLTLVSEIVDAPEVVWWAFSCSTEPPEVDWQATATAISVNGRIFEVGA